MTYTPKLYLISPPKIDDLDAFTILLAQLLAHEIIGAFQLRLKDVAEAEITRIAETILPICRQADVPFILNDRADIAQKIGADGVHLGASDGDIAAARVLLDEEAIIGRSCYDSTHNAMVAGEERADYVAFGLCYPTPTKPENPIVNHQTIKDWAFASNLPCVAIGGITHDNLLEVAKTGADFFAVISSVWQYKDGAVEAVKQFQAILENQHG